MEKILVTGGAGYKGVILVDALLKKGADVTILDNFMYGYDSVLGFGNNKNCHFISKDIRNITGDDLKSYDIIYHLAGISGYAACEANPHSAEIINVNGTRNIVRHLSPSQVLVYASTTSFYGSSGEKKDERSVVSPVSLYGVTKYEGEKICMEHANSVSMRFATLFGTSKRMRSDLLVNDFVRRAMVERCLVLFDCNSIRTYLHVNDAINAYVMVLDRFAEMKGNIFNVGSNDLNFSKLDLARKINKHIDFKIIESDLSDCDKRSFIIDYDKIGKLGFKPAISIEEGIIELKKLYAFYQPFLPYQII